MDEGPVQAPCRQVALVILRSSRSPSYGRGRLRVKPRTLRSRGPARWGACLGRTRSARNSQASLKDPVQPKTELRAPNSRPHPLAGSEAVSEVGRSQLRKLTANTAYVATSNSQYNSWAYPSTEPGAARDARLQAPADAVVRT